MDIKRFQELSQRTMPTIGSQVNVEGDEVTMTKHLITANYAMGLAGEAGEVTDLIKKSVFHGHSLDKQEAEKEIGDVMHYVAGLATLLGLDMETILDKNIKKLQKRFPNGFNSADSVKRADVSN
ncbi:nucleoside triphosphate pyrophosphohydrolase family protein [Bacillus spizizenii]|nr:nucleoside triphosphate pyrophosphohydrolase family protein [Bacillus spizizenii]MCY8219383.1 nucleoside triphosphate pyrophosphohydrolase family protein [Bacillus spizizenii]MCY8362107.1 nucleoside triphosphate pyrophosphohydrolase family protein [Bacillus spizizenii]MCY8369084.1 nucleoside triphosphate pyrophosphohydrolase family protein [Bacillus spizizenii]